MVKDEKISAEDTIRHIHRETWRNYNAEEKVRIVLERTLAPPPWGWAAKFAPALRGNGTPLQPLTDNNPTK